MGTIQSRLHEGLPTDGLIQEYLSLLLQLVPKQYQHYRADLKQVLKALTRSSEKSFSEGLWISTIEQWHEVQDVVLALNEQWDGHIVTSLNSEELPLVTFTYTVV